MEEVVLANEENSGELLVVVGHHDVLGRALAEVQQSVDVLNTSESLLPQFQFDGNVKLLEASLKMTLQGVGVAQVDGVHLRRVLGGGLDMVSEKLAESSELGLSGVLQTEVEGLHGSALVKDLETSIVAENIEDGSVRLPEELEPRSDDGSVSSVTGLLSRDGGEEDGLGGLAGFQIVDAGGGSGGFDGRLNLVGLCLGSGNLLHSEFDELFQDQLWGGSVIHPTAFDFFFFFHPLFLIQRRYLTYLNGRNVGVLGQVLVLIQGILGQLSLLLLDGELNQQEHNRLQRSDGGASGALVGDVFMEQGQGRRGLVDPDELVGALQDIFGLLMRRGRLEKGSKVSITAQCESMNCRCMGEG